MCQSIHSAVKSSVNNFVTVCAKHPRILWWRFDCDACVENVNMDVRLFSSQSFQFTVFLRSKKMFCFTALGLSLDPVNNIWHIGKSVFVWLFVLYFNSFIFCICDMLVWYLWLFQTSFGRLGKQDSECRRFLQVCSHIVSHFVSYFVALCHIMSHFFHILSHVVIFCDFLSHLVFFQEQSGCAINQMKKIIWPSSLPVQLCWKDNTHIYQHHSKALHCLKRIPSVNLKVQSVGSVQKIFGASYFFAKPDICQGVGGVVRTN